MVRRKWTTNAYPRDGVVTCASYLLPNYVAHMVRSVTRQCVTHTCLQGGQTVSILLCADNKFEVPSTVGFGPSTVCSMLQHHWQPASPVGVALSAVRDTEQRSALRTSLRLHHTMNGTNKHKSMHNNSIGKVHTTRLAVTASDAHYAPLVTNAHALLAWHAHASCDSNGECSAGTVL